MNRRTFLRVSLGAGGGLIVTACTGDNATSPQASKTQVDRTTETAGSGASPSSTTSPPETSPPSAVVPFEPNLFVRIDPNGGATLTIHRSEMGQGVLTSLAMVLADELEIDVGDVLVVQSPANKAIGSQITAGSGSIRDTFEPLRRAGATARAMLIAAAASRWGVETATCHADLGTVVNGATGERLGYGELVSAAAAIDVPADAPLKSPAKFRFIGRSVPRLDGDDIVRGRVRYGIDARRPDMRFAAVARCPVSGGTVVSYDPAAALATPGVEQVVEVSSGLAVVATSTWAAFRGRDALTVRWDEGERAAWSTDGIRGALREAMDAARAESAPADLTILEAVYETPYLAHSAMEPLNCLAHVHDRSCEISVSTQNPLSVQEMVGDELGLPVSVEVLRSGGGFGRRLEVDYAVESAEVSRAVQVPVLVTWSRTDDLQHDFPHAPTQHWLRAGWDATNALTLFRHVVVGPGLNGIVYTGGTDVLQIEQAIPYRIATKRDSAILVDVPLPTGPWRATFAWPNAFATECFLDEIAGSLGVDPVQLRLSLLPDGDPLGAVLALAVQHSEWGAHMSAGHGLGVACHTYHDTHVAMVAHVEVIDRTPVARHLVCAVDCGLVINPDMVAQQIEGGIAFGLSAVTKGALTHRAGRVEQQNFYDSPMLQLSEMPTVDVHILPSTEPPTGVGEVAVPAVVAAVVNAIHAASNQRIRTLPIDSV